MHMHSFTCMHACTTQFIHMHIHTHAESIVCLSIHLSLMPQKMMTAARSPKHVVDARAHCRVPGISHTHVCKCS